MDWETLIERYSDTFMYRSKANKSLHSIQLSIFQVLRLLISNSSRTIDTLLFTSSIFVFLTSLSKIYIIRHHKYKMDFK